MRFEVYRDRGGKWRWRLRAANGRIVASSGESFASHFNAERATRDLVEGVVSAAVHVERNDETADLGRADEAR